ncbi:LamG domain-containing protein [Gelria sp. Kuro-4]|uniref:LamG domain-containing protein n=1 Tax=Gelria sp. Kuro-4 TaxID=2796927 RepID=UPI001BEE6C2E|nr:LamG domain-containing protein [Gelria sp. Kuro-4]BCV23300.1 hypothetical protein kuro4_00730 [Gelria sp. Kuro-4]
MARSPQGYMAKKLSSFAGGLNTSNPVTIADTDLAKATNIEYTTEGRVKVRGGVKKRFSADFASNPVIGIAPYYKADGTTRLVMASGTSLYVDNPHVAFDYDSQTDFKQSGVYTNLDMDSSPGDVRMTEIVLDGFEDGTFDWWTSRDTGWTIDTAVFKTGTRSAKGTGTNQKLVRTFGGNRDAVYVKLACRFAEATVEHYPVKLISPTNTEIQAVVAGADGHFKYWNGTALANFPTDKTYAVDTWYVVEVWTRGGTFWVSIDGQSLTPSGLSLKDSANSAQSQVAKLQVQNAGATAGTMWIDDVEINPIAAVLSRSSVAYKQDGAQVAANVPRYETGKFAQAWWGEEGTTNVVADPSFETGTGWTFGAGGSRISTDHWHGGYCAKSTSNLSEDIQQTNIAVTGGTTHTLSWYGKSDTPGSPAGNGFVHFRLYNSSGVEITTPISGWTYDSGFGYYKIITLQNYWLRDSAQIVLPTNAAKMTLYFSWRSGTNPGTYALYDAIQLEQKPYATSFIDGTRSLETLTIPTAGVLSATQGTLECWIRFDDDIGKLVHAIFDARDTAASVPDYTGPHMFIHEDGKVHFRVGTGSSYYELVGATVLTKGTWYFVAFRWSASGTALLVNGTVEASSTTPPNWVLPAKAYIGCNAYGQFQLDGLIDDLRISSRARTDAEISAAYSSGLPLSWDADTTYLLDFDGDLRLPPDRLGVWTSPVQNATTAQDKSSLTITWQDTVLPNTAVACQVRTSSDGVSWSAWYDQVNGALSAAPAGAYSQVRFILQLLDYAKSPSLHKVTASYEGAPTATLLVGGLGTASHYSFAQLQDSLIVCNGVNFPRKFDGGTTADEIAAAPKAAVACTFKNRVFLAKDATNPSRLWYSGILDLTQWPGYEEVNPNDGDEIMALLPTSMTLLIVKQHSAYYLQGYSPETFQITPAGEGGTISPWGVIWTPYGIFRLDRDGVWATDFRKQILLTEKIQKVWDGLNQRQLDKAALYFYRNKLLVAVPNGISNYNDTLLVYDLSHKAWAVWTGLTPGCFSVFWEFGQWVTLFGSSKSGNVFEFGSYETDAGTPIQGRIVTKHFPLVSEEVTTRLKWVDVYFQTSSTSDSDVTASSLVDGATGPTRTFKVPLSSNPGSLPFRFYPQAFGRTVGMDIAWTGPAELEGMTFVYFPRTARPQRVI